MLRATRRLMSDKDSGCTRPRLVALLRVIYQDGKEWAVMLDHRMLRTPQKRPFTLPSAPLAYAVAAEWEMQRAYVKPWLLPLTSITSRGIDGSSYGDDKIPDDVMRYFVTDTLCFPADFPASLVRRQEESWSPIVRWAESHYGVRVGISTGLADPAHPPETLSAIRKSLDAWSQWQLVALDEAVRSSKSLLVALALLHGAVSLEQAANAARTEVLHQIERWGEVEDTHDVDYHDMRVRLGSALFLHQCVRQPPLFS